MKPVHLQPTGRYKYIVYTAVNPTRRKPSKSQQAILDQMSEGQWYCAEPIDDKGRVKDRRASCIALVEGGWLEMGRIAKPLADGTFVELTTEELLLEYVLGKKMNQPPEMFRRAKLPEVEQKTTPTDAEAGT